MTLRLATTPAASAAAEWARAHLDRSGVAVTLVTEANGLPADAAARFEGLVHEEYSALLLPGEYASEIPEGLVWGAVLPRDEPRDLLVVARGAPTPLRSLPASSRVAVAGARRRALLRAHRQDLTVVSLENGTTAAGALETGVADAIVLGALEARAHGLASMAAEILDPKAWLPGPGQGTTVLVCRPDPDAVFRMLDDEAARTALVTELALLESLGAPRGSTLGALAQPTGRWIRLWAAAASEDGRSMVRSDLTGSRDDPRGVAKAVARQLVERGLGGVLSGARA